MSDTLLTVAPGPPPPDFKLQILYTPSGKAGEYAQKGLALNPFRGCCTGCRYCYAVDVCRMSREEFHHDVHLASNLWKRLKHDLQYKHAEPIFLSFITDINQPAELKQQEAMAVVRMIKESGNRVRILTKGRMPSRMFALLDATDEVWVTLTLESYDDSRLWEPLGAVPFFRVLNLEGARKRGIKTGASCEPVLDPAQTLAMIEAAAPWLDTVKIGKTNHLDKINWPSPEWERRVRSIDWAQFGEDAVALCERLELDYYIKVDLAECLSPELRARLEESGRCGKRAA